MNNLIHSGFASEDPKSSLAQVPASASSSAFDFPCERNPQPLVSLALLLPCNSRDGVDQVCFSQLRTTSDWKGAEETVGEVSELFSFLPGGCPASHVPLKSDHVVAQ